MGDESECRERYRQKKRKMNTKNEQQHRKGIEQRIKIRKRHPRTAINNRKRAKERAKRKERE